jgi:hypothetical protein
MEQIYMMSQERSLIPQIADELISEGMDASRMHIYALEPKQLSAMPVKVSRYLTPATVMTLGAAIGILAGAVIWLLLMMDGYNYVPMLFIAMVMGAGGAISGLWFGHGLNGDLYRLNAVLLSGEVVMVVDVERPFVGQLEQDIVRRHPEVSVLGMDTEGTPPFP